MKQQETSKFLAVVKTAYPHFEISEQVVRLWHGFLAEIDYNLAKSRLGEHIRSNKFPPTIADIIRADQEQVLSVYDIQRIENDQHMLELKEYQENEDVKPMPDYIKKQLRELRMKVISDES